MITSFETAITMQTIEHDKLLVISLYDYNLFHLWKEQNRLDNIALLKLISDLHEIFQQNQFV